MEETHEDGGLLNEDYLYVPYTLMVWSTIGPDGEWVRHVEYPELPGCSVELENPIEALHRLDEMRVEYVLSRLANGESVPVPRPPLRA